jgi:hypothetical protein
MHKIVNALVVTLSILTNFPSLVVAAWFAESVRANRPIAGAAPIAKMTRCHGRAHGL